jgi:hypothetical protein
VKPSNLAELMRLLKYLLRVFHLLEAIEGNNVYLSRKLPPNSSLNIDVKLAFAPSVTQVFVFFSE